MLEKRNFFQRHFKSHKSNTIQNTKLFPLLLKASGIAIKKKSNRKKKKIYYLEEYNQKKQKKNKKKQTQQQQKYGSCSIT